MSLVPRVIRHLFLCIGPWALLLSLSGSQLHFGPCSLVPIPPFPFSLKRPLFLPMFLTFFFVPGSTESIFDALNLSLMYKPSVCRLVRFVLLGLVSFRSCLAYIKGPCSP